MTINDLINRKNELGYTNEMISAMSGVPLSTVNKIFGRVTTKPRYNTLQSIQCVLFPEDHSREEAALNKEIVQDLSREWPSGVGEETALDEYYYGYPKDEHARIYNEVLSRKKQGEFTIDDLRDLPEGTYVELIDGVIYDRSAPSIKHQFVVINLAASLNSAIERTGHGQCLVLAAPTDVQLNKDDDKNVVEPDILIVCDRDKYAGSEEIVGAPDYIAEVLSPSTEKYDRILKLNKYWRAGVHEVWLINIKDEELYVHQFTEEEGRYRTYSFEDQIPLGISEGKVTINFKTISDRMHAYFD